MNNNMEINYSSALYSLGYAGVFYSGKSLRAYNSTSAGKVSDIISNAISAGGVWPTQFGLQASFYLNEAKTSTSRSLALEYLNNAYTTALLSSNLSSLNANLQSGFVQGSNSTQQSASLASLSDSITQLTYAVIMMLIVIFALVIAFILHILEHRSKKRR